MILKKNLVLFCGNGYFLKEFYFPIVKQFKIFFNIHLLCNNSYVSNEDIIYAEKLKKSGLLKSFEISQIHTFYSIENIFYLKSYFKKLVINKD